jgi:hypothetical protein
MLKLSKIALRSKCLFFCIKNQMMNIARSQTHKNKGWDHKGLLFLLTILLMVLLLYYFICSSYLFSILHHVKAL